MKYKEPMTYFPKSIRKEIGMEEVEKQSKTKASTKPKKHVSRTTKKRNNNYIKTEGCRIFVKLFEYKAGK